jgi:uncharacterized protein
MTAPSSWRPTPFREFILKVHQRCNLSCDYCYVYTTADQTWRTKPLAMSTMVQQAVVDRIAEHVRAHDVTETRVVLHGGEPLLAGAAALSAFADRVRRAVPSSCDTHLLVQTNGVLLDRPAIEVLRDGGISIGISVDGTPASHDRHRLFPTGRGSYAAVARALALLAETQNRPAFGGLLCVIDVNDDPRDCYEALAKHAPPFIDFLLPYANWNTPPPVAGTPTPYADWLITAFDYWYHANPQRTHVRLFEELINLVLGGASRSEQIGLSPLATVVIDTDGAIELMDSLKTSYHGAPDTGLNVLRDPLDAALRHPGVVVRQLGIAGLAAICQTCPVHRVCGGGHYAHRYASSTGFANPSVYCRDLRRLIDHVTTVVTADVARLSRAAA